MTAEKLRLPPIVLWFVPVPAAVTCVCRPRPSRPRRSARALLAAPRAKDEQQQREISPPEQGFTRFVVDNMHAG